ncbi:MAG: hypothetical protein WA045_11635, partial [Nitrospira sp.]
MIESGLCQCGCGEKTAIAKKTVTRLGQVKGQPYRFIYSHINRGRAFLSRRVKVPANTTVFCGCGCGQLTKVPRKSNGATGDVKGKPRTFLHGHFFHTINLKGADSPGWRGGVRQHLGYVYLYCPDHPNADTEGYVAEHVMIASRVLGRPMKRGEHVHHANCVRSDNKNSNFVICSASFHRILHARMERMGLK